MKSHVAQATSVALALIVVLTSRCFATDVVLLEQGQARVQIVADTRGTTPAGAEILKDAASWLSASLKTASGTEFSVANQAGNGAAIIVARADAWPEVARTAGLKTVGYAIAARPAERRVCVLGNSEGAARYGVPRFKDLAIDLHVIESPLLIERRIWHAYDMSGDDLRPLMQNYQRWAVAKRLTLRGLTRTGRSCGHIIGRNKEAFAETPELSAMKEDGSRDTTSVPNARKFCSAILNSSSWLPETGASNSMKNGKRIQPLFSLHRGTIFVPREVSESEGLSTKQ